MEKTKPTTEILRELFDSQELAVLATHEDEAPYLSLMAFSAASDLKSLIFATERETRKYTNLVKNKSTSALIDNRTSKKMDADDCVAVTAIGESQELPKEKQMDAFIKQHPYLDEFVKSPSCALVEMKVRCYFVVNGLHDVREMRP